MKHCLNKRDHYNAQSQINVKEIEPEKLQEIRRFTSQQLPKPTDARRRPDVDWSYLLDSKTNPDL